MMFFSVKKGTFVPVVFLIITVFGSILLSVAVNFDKPETDFSTNFSVGLPQQVSSPDYASSYSCVECHQEICRQWESSSHAHAMDHASEHSVLGNFDDVTFLHVGFDDILQLTNEETKILLETIADAPRQAAPMSEYGENIPGRKFRVSQNVSFEDFATALRDAKPGVYEKIDKNMPPRLQKELEDDIEFLKELRYVHPGEITAAQSRIGNTLRKLIEEKRITTPIGTTFRMFRDGEKFMIETDLGLQEIRFTFGVKSLQQYLVLSDGGRVQCLPVAWNSLENQWFHLYPKEQIKPDDPLHWSKQLQNWNYMCADCHTTNFRKNFDPATNSYHSTFMEINVGCPSCHGPCENHVSMAKSHGFTKRWAKNVPTEVSHLAADEPETLNQSCAFCHARRRLVHEGPQLPERPILDGFVPEMIDMNTYYPDGQLSEEAFELGSFLQSKMCHKGVSCTHCHEAHSLKLRFEGNQLCTQCHSPMLYDTVSHHFHPDSTKPGTMCVECHFPQSHYMVVDPRRDHSIRKPNPELTLLADVPNACTDCHHDRKKSETVAWAADWVNRWYSGKRESQVGYWGIPPTERHYALGIAEGRQGKTTAAAKLLDILRDKSAKDFRPIVRAGAMTLLGQFPTSETLVQAIDGLGDESPFVQYAAVGAFTQFSPEEKRKHLPPMLRSPFLATRCEAARVLAGVSSELSETDRNAFETAKQEYIRSQEILNDHAASYLNLAVFDLDLATPKLREIDRWYALALQNIDQARKSPNDPIRQTAQDKYYEYIRKVTDDALSLYRQSLERDAGFIPSRINLAMLHNQRGEFAEAQREFREILRIDPNHGETYYSLGLLLAEQGKTSDAVPMLRKAKEFLPDNSRVRYNLGLLLMRLAQNMEAEKELLEAVEMAPENVHFLHALAVFYLQRQNGGKAMETIDRLIRLDPLNRQWAELKRLAESIGE